MAPVLREARAEFRDVRWVSITDAEEKDAIGFARDAGHDWPQLAGEAGRKLFRDFRVREIPTYYVIDAEGVIRARGHTNDWSAIRTELMRLTASRRPGSPGGASEDDKR